MILTSALLILKLMSVYIEPADPLSPADQALATCVQDEMTKRPSALVFSKTKEEADAFITVAAPTGTENKGKAFPHTTGIVTLKDGTVLASADIRQGFGLISAYDMAKFKACHKTDAMMQELAKKLKTEAKKTTPSAR